MGIIINGVNMPSIMGTDKPKCKNNSAPGLVDTSGKIIYYNLPFEEALKALRSGIYSK